MREPKQECLGFRFRISLIFMNGSLLPVFWTLS